MNRYFLGAALAAMSLICAAGAANAQPWSERQDVMVVRLSDLDTSHPAGAQSALHRIKAAAIKFCGDDGQRDLNRRFEEERCVTRMTGKAVQSLGSTQVSALYNKTGVHIDDTAGVMQLASRDPR